MSNVVPFGGLGDELMVSVDVDAYLVAAAQKRLASSGRSPHLEIADARSALATEKQTAIVALGAFQGRHVLQVNLMAAGSLIVSLPVVALYLFFQRQFISDVMAGAVKA